MNRIEPNLFQEEILKSFNPRPLPKEACKPFVGAMEALRIMEIAVREAQVQVARLMDELERDRDREKERKREKERNKRN